MKDPIYITALGSISPLGTSLKQVWNAYSSNDHLMVNKRLGASNSWVAPLADKERQRIEALRASDTRYTRLDVSVLYAIFAARKTVQAAGWKEGDDFGVNIGSSRGATTLFEKYHEAFVSKDETSPLTSPTTTLGNIASWVGHDLKTDGPIVSHSITCSTALHALLNGIAWIQSGMTSKFLVGGSEAPLTPFTVSQMRALKIYAKKDTLYPCRALDLDKKQNSVVLGEGAAVAALESTGSKKALAKIIGVGYASELLENSTSISAEGKCFQKAMRMALGDRNKNDIDSIVMHAPGTLQGDLSEYNGIKQVFGSNIPLLTTNKWKIGHTLGASGMLSIEMAVLMLQHQEFIPVPYLESRDSIKKIRTVMVNAVGFGGNAVSILLEYPS